MPVSPWPRRDGDLLFRAATEADIPALLAFRNDPVVNRFMLRTHVDEAALRHDVAAVPTSPTNFSCVAEDADRVVAMGFLDIVDGPGQPGAPTGTDGVIGYVVAPHAAGRGIATATTRALLRTAFDDLGLRRVTATANADNVASVRVLEKAGMRRERYARQALWHAELGWRDEVEHAILADDWRTGAGPGSLALLAQARLGLDRLTPHQAFAEQQAGAVLVDVRMPEHRAAAANIPGALAIDLTVLPWRLDPTFEWRIPEATSWDTRYVLFCRHGYSSSVAARTLRDLGLHRATDIDGGYEAWAAAGLPTTTEPPDIRP